MIEWTDAKRTTSLLLTGDDIKKHNLNSLKSQAVTFVKSKSDSEIIRFTLDDKAVITHDEHDKLVLPASKTVYYKVNQMEYDPFRNTMAYVFD